MARSCLAEDRGNLGASGGVSQIERGLAVEAGGPRPLNRHVGARGHEQTHDRGLIAKNGEHERAQVILGGVVEGRAPPDEERGGPGGADRDREHQARLTVRVARVEVGAIIEESRERDHVVTANGLFPLVTHRASTPTALPAVTGHVLVEELGDRLMARALGHLPRRLVLVDPGPGRDVGAVGEE